MGSPGGESEGKNDDAGVELLTPRLLAMRWRSRKLRQRDIFRVYWCRRHGGLGLVVEMWLDIGE